MGLSPKQLANARVSVINLNSTGPVAALAVVQLDSTGGIISGGAGGGSTQVSVKEILTSSGASVMDGVNNAINVNVVAGAAGGSTYVSVRQATAADLNAAVVQGSTVWQVQVSTVQGIVSVIPAAGFVSSAVLAGNSSAFNVRPVWSSTNTDQPVSLPSSQTINVRSSAANALVTAYQSTAADLQATVTPVAGSTWATRPLQSSQADLRMTAYQSTAADLNVTARLQDGSGNALESSTSAASSGARGLITRQAWNGGQTFAASTVGNSSATTINASNAANRAYVYAYSVKSTLTGSITGGFYDGTTLIWPILLASTGGVLVGDNLAVTPPAYLFRGTTGAALTFNFSASNAGVSLGVSYWVST